MNYRELKQYLSTFTDEQLERDVVIIDLDQACTTIIDGIRISDSKDDQ